MAAASQPRALYLVRHGRTALNAAGKLRGRLDPPLDETGLGEVDDLGRAFASLPGRPARIVAGPLRRTRDTAEAIARYCGVEVIIDDRLVDRDYGPWTGQSVDVVRARWGAELDLPDAESPESVADRACAVLVEQVDFLRHGPVVLVAHDVVNGMLLSRLDPGLGPPHAVVQHTAAWNQLARHGDGWQVVHVDGDASSLRGSADLGSLDAEE